jgi:outer membrane biosynthesis protein TonB
MKQQLQRVVPHATERFHDALDELENEVRLAQTVLRRDMALLKQDRKKKEAAAKQHEVDKARLAAESRTAPAPASAPAPVDEAPVKVEQAVTPTPPEPAVSQAEVPEPASANKSEQAQEQQPEQEPELQEVPNKDEDTKAPPPPIETDVEPQRDPLFDGTPTTGNAQESEFDFDAMFADAMDTTGDNTHNDMMDTSGDMDFTLDHGNDGPSLLRGLEDFAKDSDVDNANQASNMDIDFTMPDLPGLDMNTEATANTSDNATAAKPAEPEPASKPEEPKPEELKPTAEPPVEEKEEEPAVTTNDEMMGTMATDDLEDLFNMDEYENPEQSQFDDAFFNFE